MDTEERVENFLSRQQEDSGGEVGVIINVHTLYITRHAFGKIKIIKYLFILILGGQNMKIVRNFNISRSHLLIREMKLFLYLVKVAKPEIC